MISTYAKNVVDFCRVLRLKSQEAYAVVKANLLSVSIRHLKRVASQQQQNSPVVDLSFNGLAQRMSSWFAPMIEGVEKDGGTYLLVSLEIDATKVPPKYQLNLPYKVFVGRKFPHHMIALSGIEDTDGIERQNPFLDIASEVTCSVMTVQNASPRYSHTNLIAARPQSTNECTPEFNTLLELVVKSNPRVRLLSMAFGGVSSEADYVRDMLVDILNGRGDTVSVVDPNHVAKAVRSQLIIGCNIVLAGDYLVDPGLLPAANVSKELYQVTDYTSDLLVIRLCSPITLQLLAGVAECQNQVSMVAHLGLPLFFLRLFLIGVNCDSVSKSTQICYIWCAMLWFTSLTGIHWTTRRNLVTSAIGMWSREFSVSVLTLPRKLDEILRCSFESDIRNSREGLKSYQASFPRDKQNDSGTAGGYSGSDDVIPSKADDGIKVDRSGVGSVAEQIETALHQLLNLTIRQMQNLLNRAGFQAMSRNSPCIGNFWTLKDLAKEFLKYMPGHKSIPMKLKTKSLHLLLIKFVNQLKGILTGSPKEDEAVVLPSVQSRLTEGASEDIISDIRRGALARLLDERSQIRSPSTLFVEAAQALGGQKVFAGSGSTLALQKAKSLQGRWYDKGNIRVDGDKSSRDTQSPYQLRR
ncbi:hypothetical protein PsorP6_019322 [Peronosclerospora sorghi]|nr:hypothetical protein PsorP6_019312 [Peronosclerospora sorghi]KAI9895235.1 hypothetical protein PsorP6_019322 [Peronosclerospora sorghi]